MSQGIRLNLIGIWLQDERGEDFFYAVERVLKKTTEAQFKVFQDVWKGVTYNYRVRVRLPTLQVSEDGILNMAWSFTDETMQFLVSVDATGGIDWYVYDHSTGWSDGSPDYTTHVSEVPLEMVRRFFPVIIVDNEPAEE